MTATSVCPNCHSQNLIVQHHNCVTRQDRVYIGNPDGWQCSDCGRFFGVPPDFILTIQPVRR